MSDTLISAWIGWLLLFVPALALLAAGCVRTNSRSGVALVLVAAAFLCSILLVAGVARYRVVSGPFEPILWFRIATADVFLSLSPDRFGTAMLALLTGVAWVGSAMDRTAPSVPHCRTKVLVCLSVAGAGILLTTNEPELVFGVGWVVLVSVFSALMVSDEVDGSWLSCQLVGDTLLLAAAMGFIEWAGRPPTESSMLLRAPSWASGLWLSGLLIKATNPLPQSTAPLSGRIWQIGIVSTICTYLGAATIAQLVPPPGRIWIAAVFIVAASASAVAALVTTSFGNLLNRMLAAHTMLVLAAVTHGSTAVATAHLIVAVCAIVLLASAGETESRPARFLLSLALFGAGAFPLLGTFWTLIPLIGGLLDWSPAASWPQLVVLDLVLTTTVLLAASSARLWTFAQVTRPPAVALSQGMAQALVCLTACIGGLGLTQLGALQQDSGQVVPLSKREMLAAAIDFAGGPTATLLVVAASLVGWTGGTIAAWRGWRPVIQTPGQRLSRSLATLGGRLQEIGDYVLWNPIEAVQRAVSAAGSFGGFIGREDQTASLALAAGFVVVALAIMIGC
jgi:hypothetical protein